MRLSYLLRLFLTAPLYDMQFTVYIGQGGRVTMIYICVPEVPGSNRGYSKTLTYSQHSVTEICVRNKKWRYVEVL